MDDIINAIKDAQQNWPVEPVIRGRVWPRFRYPYYIDRQILITGRKGEIEPVIEAVNRDVEAENAKAENLAKLPKIGRQLDVEDLKVVQYLPVTPGNGKLSGLAGVEIRLYDLVGDESEAGMWAVVRLVHKWAAALGNIVLADPNMIVSNPVSGGAGGVTGGPIGLPVGLGGPGAAERFWKQWAFYAPFGNGRARRRGINLEKRGPRGNGANRPVFAETGQKIQIFVLDTADDSLAQEGKIRLPGQNQEVPVTVTRLAPRVTIEPPPGGAKDVSPHGRFICGLLQRVAPQAELNLVQLLNKEGQGELFSLVCALLVLAEAGLTHNRSKSELPLSSMVINLSLAADLSEDRILTEGVRAEIETMWRSEAIQTKYKGNEGDILYRLLEDIYARFYYGPSLRIPILLLTKLGAVIVAAAGNESADRYGNLPALVPARYPEVIGVAASNMHGDLSSFSNTADIRAPGGGHEDVESPIVDLARLESADEDLEPYGILSLVPKTDAFPHGLAYWWGTSFSTPLVAGLAALVMQKKQAECGHSLPPDKVKAIIEGGLRNGIIDVEATLNAVTNH